MFARFRVALGLCGNRAWRVNWPVSNLRGYLRAGRCPEPDKPHPLRYTPREGATLHAPTSSAFKENAHRALGDAGLQRALARSGTSFIARRAAAVANLPEFESLRDTARDIKNHTLAHLDF